RLAGRALLRNGQRSLLCSIIIVADCQSSGVENKCLRLGSPLICCGPTDSAQARHTPCQRLLIWPGRRRPPSGDGSLATRYLVIGWPQFLATPKMVNLESHFSCLSSN